MIDLSIRLLIVDPTWLFFFFFLSNLVARTEIRMIDARLALISDEDSARLMCYYHYQKTHEEVVESSVTDGA